MAGRRGKRAEVREIEAEALSANDFARIARRRDRVTRAMQLARQQLAEASAQLVEREPKKARWYCLQIGGKSEFSVEKLLVDAAVNVLLPRDKSIVVRKQRKIEIERPILPGYLLVQIVPSAKAFEGLRSQRGVVDFVGNSTGYHVIRDTDVAAFRTMTPVNIAMMATDKSLGIGAKAEIVIGPFAGFQCVILAVKWSREARGRVVIEAGGKALEIESMPLAFLKKL